MGMRLFGLSLVCTSRRLGTSLRNFSSAQPSDATRVKLHPPGSGVSPDKANTFCRLVSGELAKGRVVELTPVGLPATFRSLLVLAADPDLDPMFEVSWVDAEAGYSRPRDSAPLGDSQKLRIIASRGDESQSGRPWLRDITGGYFVSNQTEALPLARKIVLELRKSDRVTLHTYADAEKASSVLLRAVATAQRLQDDGGDSGNERAAPLRCIARCTHADTTEKGARLVVHISKQPNTGKEKGLDSTRRKGKGESNVAGDWIGFPPGANADPEYLKQFLRAVKQRLSLGQAVSMECRGKDSVVNVLAALATVQNHTAEFEVRWVDSSKGGTDAGARALHLRAVSGQTWNDFNGTDFSQTRRFIDTSDVRKLASRLASEVRQRGGVAVHVPFQDADAVVRAIKSLASVFVESGGLRVICIPSLGATRVARGTAEADAGLSRQTLRLFVRLRGVKASDSESATVAAGTMAN